MDPVPAGWMDWVPGLIFAVAMNWPWSKDPRDTAPGLLVTGTIGVVTTGMAVVPKATTLG